ncbi:hypothetical protein AX15_007715 [Amanita polypyramis BW_CC]|nr:hypothetical protein AX15_007715 [Amanita polypyramis BW_CC]
MAPRQRHAHTGQHRTHSRSSSSTRVGANLQFTQKDPPPAKLADKIRKNDLHGKPHPGFVRANSNQGVRSKENVQHFPAKRPSSSKHNGTTKAKAGFTLAHQGDQDDDDGWVSTESGAASSDHSDSEIDAKGVREQFQRLHVPDEQDEPVRPQIEREETPRPSQQAWSSAYPTARDMNTKQLPPLLDQYFNPGHEGQLARELSTETMREPLQRRGMPPSPPSRRYPGSPGTGQHSRPPSMHSTSSKNEPVLRPHPLSYIPKQSPLAPLAVIPDFATSVSTSPKQSYHDGDGVATSPSSVTPSDAASGRRSSISSARSVSTVPVFYTRDVPRGLHERTRTLSNIPTSSSSAALSSLTHLPTVTRAPSPQAIVFFPPHNPHANIDGIHPLLPSPYMSNHMTVLTRRTPLRESYDRVTRAKLAASQ